jgi:hypothetical protein
MPAAVGSSAFKVFMMNDGIGKVALTSIHEHPLTKWNLGSFVGKILCVNKEEAGSLSILIG